MKHASLRLTTTEIIPAHVGQATRRHSKKVDITDALLVRAQFLRPIGIFGRYMGFALRPTVWGTSPNAPLGRTHATMIDATRLATIFS